jgi:CheY-like chemotaxis protein
MNILLVDDDVIDRKAVVRGFQNSNVDCTIVECANGEEALRAIRGEGEPLPRPFITLLDINMPVMNGFEFLESLRMEDNDKSIRDSVVFVLTTSAAEEDKRKAYDYGVAGYIVKADFNDGFSNIVSMLDAYDSIVEYP